MTPLALPAFGWTDWLPAALDPVLVVVAVLLGWRADQAGKVFIAAIAALGLALLVDALLTRLGIPWFAPLSRDGALFIPVRYVAALAWAGMAYAAARIRRGRTTDR